MAKHDLLTEEEFANYKPPKRAVRQLEQYAESRGLDPSKVKVLDWGCGRGRFVLWLREHGFDAYGVDIDAEPVQNGLPLFKARGYKEPLSTLSPQGRTVYQDGFFDFIMTDNVLEHVSDLQKVVDEIDRLTSTNGGGYHIFPAQRQPLEGHLFMPFVHWIPQGKVRKSLIRFWVRSGKEPKWKEVEGADLEKKTEVYYKYSTDHIFYRPFKTIRSCFEQKGFKVTILSLQNPAIQQHKLLGPLARIPLIKTLIRWMVLTFKQVELKTRRKQRLAQRQN